MSSSKIGKFQFAIDRGGTFTDIHAICPGKMLFHSVSKVYHLSVFSVRF